MKVFNIPKEDLVAIDGKVFAVETTADGYHGIAEGRYNFEITSKDEDLFVYPIFWNGDKFERINDFVARTDKEKAFYVGNTTIDPYNHPTLEEVKRYDGVTKEEQLFEAFKYFVHDYFSFTNTFTFLTGKIDLLPSPNVVKVESVSLDRKTAQIFTGDSVTLKATVLPDKASNKEVTFEATGDNLVLLEPSGDSCVVTGENSGEATVTVKTVDGNFTDSCVFTIKQYIDIVSVKVLGATEVNLGDTAQYSVKITPEDATDQSVVWSVNNNEVATIDQTGKLTPIKAGTVSVRATTSDSKYDDLTVTIKTVIPVESITIKGKSPIRENSNPTFTAEITPPNATDQTVTWSSNNEAFIAVDQSGNITLATTDSGNVTNAVISAVTSNGKKADFSVEVQPELVSAEITPKTIKLKPTETAEIAIAYTPANGYKEDLTWEIADPEIISFEGTTVTAIKDGESLLDLKDNGATIGFCDVTVSSTP